MEVYVAVPDSTELPSTCAISWAAKAQGFFRNYCLLLALCGISAHLQYFIFFFLERKASSYQGSENPGVSHATAGE